MLAIRVGRFSMCPAEVLATLTISWLFKKSMATELTACDSSRGSEFIQWASWVSELSRLSAETGARWVW